MGTLSSVFIRLAATRRLNPARERGQIIDLGPAKRPWIRLPLQANLGSALSDVLGYPVAAAATSRFAGFARGRSYSGFLDPSSPYYQAWLGGYMIWDEQGVERFGFDRNGRPDPELTWSVLEADQRLVHKYARSTDVQFAGGNKVRPAGELTMCQAEMAGQTWWRITGLADSFSVFHRGTSRGHPRFYRLYGQVPVTAGYPVEDFHPLRYSGEFWMRYEETLHATCARFCVYAGYADRNDQPVAHGQLLAPQATALLAPIRFRQRR